MIGIAQIASYLPPDRISNYDSKDKFGINDDFIQNKIGFEQFSRKEKNQNTSDMCIKAFENLDKKIFLNKEEIDILLLVTQNPDQKIPHTAAIIHNKLDMPKQCVCFDISQGCAGYVHGLAVIKSFMELNKLKKGLLFTCDPYSKIIDSSDKNTSLLFGDGASVTLVTYKPIYDIGSFSFGTLPQSNKHLTCEKTILYMSGREIFNFALREVLQDITFVLNKNNMRKEQIDLFLMHQGSRYIIDMLCKKMGLSKDKMPFDAKDYGNTVSSSIPIILEKNIDKEDKKNILLSGFGVGLSWGSTIIRRT